MENANDGKFLLFISSDAENKNWQQTILNNK
ncbi:CLUMA_CG021323, isoform A [Clunio marinus]|uniref:CLUMA_CG021323, isoform A n=1 Tax=Clunio marinus TaxID=568069 RepID=A0A1J1JBH7_9DIPT|nr:CLUMA_CG021323, isoform A [Clunio marinus]